MEAVGATRVAVAGLGLWGSNLARNFNELAGLAWVCDTDESRLAAAAARYPAARASASFDDLLADEVVEAVVVATPVPTHADLARRALAAGKHVFVEKPLALAADEAEELVALAEERGLVLMPGHLLLYHPGVAKLKEIVDSSELGEVLYVYGNRQNLGTIRPDENALWSLGPHDISVMLHLVGERPSEVAASGESYLQPGVEDVVFGRIRFPSGILGHLHLSWLDPQKMRRMTVIGSERMVVFDDMETERKVTVYDKAPIPRTETYGEYIQVRSGDIHIPKVRATEPLRIVCERFAEAVRDRRPTPSDGRAGAAVVEVLEAMTASLAASGEPVRLLEEARA
jgi:predicted dehydrogenase